MSKSYIVIQQSMWCNENGHGIDYASDSVEFDKRHKAIKHGLKQQGSDDFNIGVIENGCLVSFDWMNKPIDESAEKLAEIAEAIGYEGAAQ
ncbi:TPA: antitoxin [Citrobacter braakii]|nr:antitoxin [Citrobacter braakii]